MQLRFGVSPYIDIKAPERDGRFVPRYLADTQTTSEAPQTQDQTNITSSSSDSSALAPLRQVPVEAFAPYLDDDTGNALDSEGRPVLIRPRSDAPSHPQESSSPVDQFSPTPRSPSGEYDPRPLPGVGTWMAPKPEQPRRRIRYTRDELINQLRQLESDDDLDISLIETQEEILRETNLPPGPSSIGMEASQPAPEPTYEPSQPSTYPQLGVGRIHEARSDESESQPRESTPTGARVPDADSRRPVLPSQPIASPQVSSQPIDAAMQDEEAPVRPATTPTMASSQPVPGSRRRMPRSSIGVSHSDISGSSSMGWSTLPRQEVIELVNRSPHVPAFLREEVGKFVLRAKRAAQSQRSSNVLSASQSQSQSQDTSETQEDGFLRTKNIWCFELLVTSSSVNAAGMTAGLDEASDLMMRLTQSQPSSSQARVIILLIDTAEGTFDIQEVEDSLASILRKDTRYSAWHDADGRKWSSNTAANPAGADLTRGEAADAGQGAESAAATAAVAAAPDLNAEIAKLQTEVAQLRTALSSAEQARVKAERSRDEAKEDRDFIRGLYDRASASAGTAQAEAAEATERADRLEQQLNEGLEMHKKMSQMHIERVRSDMQQLETQMKILHEQIRLTDQESIRQKAALWDAKEAEERDRERERKQRIKANEEKRRKLVAELGGDPNADLSSGVQVPITNRDPSPVDELDELAALAAEAAEAGAAEEDHVGSSDLGRGARRRRRAAAAPVDPVRDLQNAEAAQLASTSAAEQTREEIEDQLASFAPADPAFDSSMPDLSASQPQDPEPTWQSDASTFEPYTQP